MGLIGLEAYSLGAYSLGVYMFERPILDLAAHLSDWEPTVWEPTAWVSRVSSHRFWTSPPKHLSLTYRGPFTRASLFREIAGLKKKHYWKKMVLEKPFLEKI